MKPRILCFAGSLRRDSVNKKLIGLAAQKIEEAGGEATILDLKDLPMPIYDGDLEAEEGIPENARKFKKLLNDHHGLLISSPEYNSSISGTLKNAIDWATRQEPGEKALACFSGKVAGLLSASPSLLGGLRGLITLRSILGNIRVIVIPEQFTLPQAYEAFNENGSLKDAKQEQSMQTVAARLVEVAGKLHA